MLRPVNPRVLAKNWPHQKLVKMDKTLGIGIGFDQSGKYKYCIGGRFDLIYETKYFGTG
jgi:hypothetical protein